MSKYDENVHQRINAVALWAVGSFGNHLKLYISRMFFPKHGKLL